MARRKKQQTDPVRALAGLLMVGAFFGVFKLTNSIIAGIIAVVMVFATFFIIMTLINKAHEERLKKSGIADIDKMSLGPISFSQKLVKRSLYKPRGTRRMLI